MFNPLPLKKYQVSTTCILIILNYLLYCSSATEETCTKPLGNSVEDPSLIKGDCQSSGHTMADSKPLLGYWNIRGLGQTVRFLLAYLDVDFEEKRYELTPELTYDNWYADKEKLGLDFPNLPYLFDGPEKITETRAILKYLSRTRKPELLGKAAEIATKIDMVDNFLYDLYYIEFAGAVYGYTDELAKAFKETAAVRLGRLSTFMKENEWITGNDITYVDFFLYECLYQFKKFDANCLDKFPNLAGLITRFENLPEIKKYIGSPKFLQGPITLASAAHPL
ncbi:unnamed protein product [Orchesella dallaii]|uniref:glutathione transferase n=1 Tax=Orchesella dallaii TaxID=48710 RepID=A0ABP1RVS6_9HEXA